MGKDEKRSKYHQKFLTAAAVLQSPIIIISCRKRKALIYFFLKANSSNLPQFVHEIFISKVLIYSCGRSHDSRSKTENNKKPPEFNNIYIMRSHRHHNMVLSHQ